jgi:hypothetical protein
MRDIAEQLREATMDWNGEKMVDGEPPIDVLKCGDLRRAANEIERLRTALRDCARNDRSRYNHHEPRPFDGKKPSPGTIWLTPREIARSVLREPALATGDDI